MDELGVCNSVWQSTRRAGAPQGKRAYCGPPHEARRVPCTPSMELCAWCDTVEGRLCTNTQRQQGLGRSAAATTGGSSGRITCLQYTSPYYPTAFCPMTRGNEFVAASLSCRVNLQTCESKVKRARRHTRSSTLRCPSISWRAKALVSCRVEGSWILRVVRRTIRYSDRTRLRRRNCRKTLSYALPH